ncbi:MgtC/SapB family protein [Lysinibacter sp. HNR]|uniref:MgtC/SapB family protein n=1 Tax=Lysinibacter sp. HNR TaxID=3031408 RepID=UPI00243571F0|nr:MgtC/SapB family protein [Lysinibacter sp. HNR]WGD37321.1 MgtC/SapB family protein [Lysinibacter sp. HNR]
MNLDLETVELCVRVIAALIFGAAIGLERQWLSRMAGIRTNALVAGGAALFVMIGSHGFSGGNADPTRVAAQVVSGIGFLGAGVILREGLNIRGLNTAATLWCSAAVGSLAGAGMYWLALFGSIAVICSNILMRPLGRFVNRHSRTVPRRAADPAHAESSDNETVEFMLEARTNDKSEPRIRALMLQAVNRPEFSLHSIQTVTAKNSQVVVRAEVTGSSSVGVGVLERAVERISLDPKVVAARWQEVDADD